LPALSQLLLSDTSVSYLLSVFSLSRSVSFWHNPPTMPSEHHPKPLLRGHFHQAAFFIAVGACTMLVFQAHDFRARCVALVYSLSLTGLLGVSALYHRVQWNEPSRLLMRRLDHAAIFVLIAGTVTPISVLALSPESGIKLLSLTWGAALIGILIALFWTRPPKWASVVFYVAVGWLGIPFFSELGRALSPRNVALLLTGGITYTIGALIYAFKRPNPNPRVFGYHEIFHIFVVVAALLHFLVIDQLVR
jgi:hemolysin III